MPAGLKDRVWDFAAIPVETAERRLLAKGDVPAFICVMSPYLLSSDKHVRPASLQITEKGADTCLLADTRPLSIGRRPDYDPP